MELISCIPWIRFADNLHFVRQRGPSKTYDCRMFYTLRGEASLELDGNSYTLRHGCAVIFQSGTQYCIRPVGELTLTVLDFDFTQEYSDHEELLPPCPVKQFRPEQSHRHVTFSDAEELNTPLFLERAFFLEPTLQGIVSEFRNKHLFFRGKVSTLFKDALFEIVRTQHGGAKQQDVLTRLQDYIDSNISMPLTNRSLGEAMGYNPNYLNQLVLRMTDLSLHKYVLHRRLARATELLAATRKPLGEISAELGFCSVSHFSSFFKQTTGVTPAQYRKSCAL